VEGELSPDNGVLSNGKPERSEAEGGGSAGLCLWRGR
jgi:hypothetical protein